MDKEIKRIHKIKGGTFLFETYEKPLRQQIAEFKQQLEEKDKEIEFCKKEIRKRNKRIDEIVERDKKLFDDKDKEIESLKQQLEESFTEKDVEGLIEDRNKTIKFLQNQLEEKDKEIVWLKAEPQKIWDDNLQGIKNDIVDKFVEQIHKEYRKEFDRRVEEKAKFIKDDFENQRRLLTESFNSKVDELHETCNKHWNARLKLMKNQTQLAIQELEKVRKEFEIRLIGKKWEDKMLIGKVCNMINDVLDNQIKELKGE